MGLASFNRMRMQQKEEMKPENIQKRQKEVEQKSEIKEEMPSKRKEQLNKKSE